MRMLLVFMITCCCYFHSSCQSGKKKLVAYNIDSLLKTPVVLPDSGYSIKDIEFVAKYGGEAREIEGSLRDRFLQIQTQCPQIKWEATNATAAFRIGDTTVFLPLAGGHNGKLSFLVDSWGNTFAPEVRVKARMIANKYLRYGVKRDFLVKEIEVIKQN
ncbi:hypothetical protein [Pedobacter sp. V48]|uniref:hypothetical protein n=1 Tax=Pedobacter sp. V48 TaxID=509635 RepID=UPI0003E56AC7|nr:hypothetical protein [Pedobacter sp. V48]ETZ19561.1 hypothetical protein N824_12530 [Pedobacter sp. V48]